MTLSQQKIALEEKIKTHKRAVNDVPWPNQKALIEAKIEAFNEVKEMIEGPNPTISTEIDDSTPDCDCDQHKYWHPCPFHGWCNKDTGVGI